MKRRSFVKNIGALVVASQIGITEAKPESKEDVIHDLILQNDEGIIKMKLLEISQVPFPLIVPNPATCDVIHIKAKMNVFAHPPMYDVIKLIYKPDENIRLSGEGFISDWIFDINTMELEFYFKFSGAMLMK